MYRVEIILTKEDDKYRGGIGRDRIPTDGRNVVVLTENEWFQTKEIGWTKLFPKIETLDFVNDQVFFNNTRVNSLQEVEELYNYIQ